MTDLRRYRRERERARRARPQKTSPREPILGRRRNAGLVLIVVIAILMALGLLSGHRF